MAHVPEHLQQGTRIGLPPEKKEKPLSPEEECRRKGGTWDAQTNTCIPKLDLSSQKFTEKPLNIITPKEKAAIQTKRAEKEQRLLESGQSFIRDAEGNITQQSPELLQQGKADIARTQSGRLTDEQLVLRQQAQASGQQLAGQVGEFGQLGVSPTGLSETEALTAGIRDAIPSAIRLAAAGFIAGGTAAALPTGGVGAPIGAVIGGAAGFIAGITGGMISNFKSQRSDTTTSQQRILDEGKQTLNDWVTLAKADPANRQVYLSNFNQQLALIDQAFRQMRLDTSRDILKFETALPNLAEFESFYNLQGERDFLVAEMRAALLTPSDLNFEMLQLANRRTE